MLSIDKQYYYIDLESIDEFIFGKKDGNNTPDEEIISGAKGNIIQKTTIKRNNNDEKYINVRYDIVKSMLDVVYNSGIESEEGSIKYIQDTDEMSIGSKLVFNTLLVNEFIKNKLD